MKKKTYNFFELLILNINLTFEKPRLEQASHWEVTKHHLQSAKHNISSESLTPSGHHLDGGEGVDEDGDNGDDGKDGDDGEDGDDGDEDDGKEGDGDEDGGDVQINLTRIMLSRMLTCCCIFSNLRNKSGHKRQGCGVNLHVTATRWLAE